MKKTYIMKTVCAVSLTAACAWGLAACTGGSDGATGTGAVAGTVNGVDIPEDSITNYIQSVRDQLGASDEESWGTWLAQNDYTPASVRAEVFTSFVQRELVKEAVEEKGITVDSSEIDEQVDSVKKNYDTDEKWQAALEQAGMTEDEYRAEIEQKLKENKLYASFAPSEDPTDADMLQYAQMYASAYDGKSKRSSHILFDASDEATAQEVLDKINSGELDFVEAVKEYSTDTVSAEQDGDVGWTEPSNLVSDYKTAAEALEKGQVSGLVTTSFGIHIIKCTDVYEAPKTTGEDGAEVVEITSIDQIPSEWVDVIKTQLQTKKQQEAYQQWLEEATDAADIKENDLPQGLPYDLDMSKYVTDSGDSNATDNGDGSTDASDGATDGSASSADSGENADASAEGTGASDEAAQSSGQPAEAA